MHLSLKDRKLILKWFDFADEAGSLTDADLKLYDKINDALNEDEYDSEDPLAYRHKKEKDDTEVCDLDNENFDENIRFENMDDYSEEEEEHY